MKNLLLTTVLALTASASFAFDSNTSNADLIDEASDLVQTLEFRQEWNEDRTDAYWQFLFFASRTQFFDTYYDGDRSGLTSLGNSIVEVLVDRADDLSQADLAPLEAERYQISRLLQEDISGIEDLLERVQWRLSAGYSINSAPIFSRIIVSDHPVGDYYTTLGEQESFLSGVVSYHEGAAAHLVTLNAQISEVKQRIKLEALADEVEASI